MSNSPEQEQKLIPSHHMVKLPTLIIWLGLWSTVVAVCLMLASMSLSGIISAGPEPLETRTRNSASAQDGNTAQTPPKTPQTDDSSGDKSVYLPIWLFVVLGCVSAGGSFFVTQVLMRSSSTPKLTKKPHPSGKATRVKGTRIKQGKKQVMRTKKQPQPRVAKPRTQPQPTPKTTVQPSVTVLSPQEQNPLDSREKSLVDLMDMRKRGSMPNVVRR